jgi:chromosome segregation ATPase
MPLELQYDSKDAIPEDFQDSFTEFKDGDKTVYVHKDLAEARKEQYRLKGDLSEAQKKAESANSRLTELERAEQERKEREQQRERDELEGKGQYKEILEDEKRRHGETKKQYDERIAKLQKQLRDKELSSVISKVEAKAPEKSRKELARIAKLDFDFNEDGELVVLDENGKATSQSVDDYLASLPERYPTLVSAVQSNGGKGKGGRGGSDDSAKTMNRSDFDNLSQPERMKFIKAGGKVSN